MMPRLFLPGFINFNLLKIINDLFIFFTMAIIKSKLKYTSGFKSKYTEYLGGDFFC